jgi:hypothetical protein
MNNDSYEKVKYWADFVRHHLDKPLIGLVATEKDLQPQPITD